MASNPTRGFHAGQYGGSEGATEVVTLFAPIDAETQQGAAFQAGRGQVDAQGCEYRFGGGAQLVGVVVDAGREAVALGAADSGQAVGADQCVVIQ